MKKAVLLHGTDGNPNDHWFPWLKQQLENHGYEVFAPELPGKHTPNRQVYEDFLLKSEWDFSDNIVVGHSSGATTALNLLSADWFPNIKAAVLVGTFLNERLLQSVEWYEPGQFDNLFLDEYSPEAIKARSSKFVFVHGDDDPYCDIGDARNICDQLDGEFITIENGGHLSSKWGITEMPKIVEALKEEL